MNQEQQDALKIAIGRIIASTYRARQCITEQYFYDHVTIREALGKANSYLAAARYEGVGYEQTIKIRDYIAALEHADMMARMGGAPSLLRSFAPVLENTFSAMVREVPKCPEGAE